VTIVVAAASTPTSVGLLAEAKKAVGQLVVVLTATAHRTQMVAKDKAAALLRLFFSSRCASENQRII